MKHKKQAQHQFPKATTPHEETHAALEPKRPAESPVVEKVHQHCPHCGSVRSRLVFTKPDDCGRMEHRQCKACLKAFRVWDGKNRLRF